MVSSYCFGIWLRKTDLFAGNEQTALFLLSPVWGSKSLDPHLLNCICLQPLAKLVVFTSQVASWFTEPGKTESPCSYLPWHLKPCFGCILGIISQCTLRNVVHPYHS